MILSNPRDDAGLTRDFQVFELLVALCSRRGPVRGLRDSENIPSSAAPAEKCPQESSNVPYLPPGKEMEKGTCQMLRIGQGVR